jgi:hypothetical protein
LLIVYLNIRNGDFHVFLWVVEDVPQRAGDHAGVGQLSQRGISLARSGLPVAEDSAMEALNRFFNDGTAFLQVKSLRFLLSLDIIFGL